METDLSRIGEFPFQGESEAAVRAFTAWKNRLLDLAVDHPLETLLILVMGSAWVFYLAEKEANDGIETYDDAVYYISTCLSVGYANVFPVTQLGKFVAAVVMILGPSLSGWVVEGRLTARQREAGAPPVETPAPPSPAVDLAPVVARLDAILRELQAQASVPEGRAGS